MRILLVHNYYQQYGGEDVVFENEKALLLNAGHDVFTYERHNDEINHYTIVQKLALFPQTTWNQNSARTIQAILERNRPEVVHFTNTFPLISPSAYYVCQKENIPVVQTLQNYRLFCAGAYFLRDGKICEACLGKTPPWPAIFHACYRQSRIQSSAVTMLLTIHRRLKTWQKQVNIFVTATEFSRQKFIQAGLPADKIIVKPNFLQSIPENREVVRDYALFVGRLSVEKGLYTLLNAWQQLPSIPLKIVGGGPLLQELKSFVQENNLEHIEFLGMRSRKHVLKIMGKARFLVFPSQWYEGFPMTLLEAYSVGLPVIASNIGGLAEIVNEGQTGLHFACGKVDHLIQKATWLWANPEANKQMGENALHEIKSKYMAKYNYKSLMNIYKKAIFNSNTFANF